MADEGKRQTDRDEEPTRPRSTVEEEEAEEDGHDDAPGDSASASLTAPDSAGLPHADQGTVDPGGRGPDIRPADNVRDPGPARRPDESAVPSGTDRSEGQGVGSGSSGGAAASAGSGRPGARRTELDRDLDEEGRQAREEGREQDEAGPEGADR